LLQKEYIAISGFAVLSEELAWPHETSDMDFSTDLLT
jgi:hypothetical protein